VENQAKEAKELSEGSYSNQRSKWRGTMQSGCHSLRPSAACEVVEEIAMHTCKGMSCADTRR